MSLHALSFPCKSTSRFLGKLWEALRRCWKWYSASSLGGDTDRVVLCFLLCVFGASWASLQGRFEGQGYSLACSQASVCRRVWILLLKWLLREEEPSNNSEGAGMPW